MARLDHDLGTLYYWSTYQPVDLDLRHDDLAPSYDDIVLSQVLIEAQGMRTIPFSQEEVICLPTPFFGQTSPNRGDRVDVLGSWYFPRSS